MEKQNLHAIKDTDEIFNKWEDAIRYYHSNLEKLTIAEVEFNSVMARELVRQRKIVGATLAKDVAKGCVEDAYLKLGEATRRVKASKEIIMFLKELNIDRRMKQKVIDEIIK